MNTNTLRAFSFLLASALMIGAAAPSLAAGAFSVKLDTPLHGKFEISPTVPAHGKFPAGTVVTVTTRADPGYTFDSGYYSTPGRWGAMYYESMTPTFKVKIDKDLAIGASFIEQSAVAHVDVKQDIVYAKPGVKPLKYDVFTPKGAKGLPIVVIIHGGGWVTNDENIMRGLARELTRGGKFVVASIDYRWAGKADGDATSNTMANLIEDVYGAVAHIREHAKDYGGDASRVVLTGDSAGGHLSAAASLMADKIGDRGFGRKAGVFEFKPSYLPKGKSVGDVRKEMMASIKAAAPSYGVFDGPFLNHHSEDPAADDTWKAAISPQRHVPRAWDRAVPQYLIRGTRDPLIQDEMCRSFMEVLVNAQQRVQYVQVGGAQHAFFDWKPDAATKATFQKFGVYYAAEMKAFFESVLSR
jgi:acetyl esterase/lipase